MRATGKEGLAVWKKDLGKLELDIAREKDREVEE